MFAKGLRARIGWVGTAWMAVGLAGCSDWPGLNDKPNGADNSITAQAPGTCSGSPEPCAALTTSDCGTTPGCTDNGSCTGVSATIGETCGTQFSPVSCNGTAGCVWATNCTGTPYGTCSAVTQAACLIAPGCVWTPTVVAGTGTGGTGATCTTYSQSCTTSAQCDCGYSCVLQCSGCTATCGRACQTDTDCTGSTGSLGLPTPSCLKVSPTVEAPYTGICSN